MKKILSLGIPNPLVRVLAWLFGCFATSVGALLAGGAGALLIGLVLVVALAAHVIGSNGGLHT